MKKEEVVNMKMSGMPTLVHRGANGEIKQIWNANKLGKAVLSIIRKIAPSESKLAQNGIQISLFGSFKNDLALKNLITSAGKAGVASRFNGAGAEAAFTYLAVGVGTTAAAVGDTTLVTEIVDSGLARAAATCTRVTTAVTNDTAQQDKTWSVTGTKAVTECGIFNAASAGTLVGRQVFTAVNVISGDSLQIIYKVAMA